MLFICMYMLCYCYTYVILNFVTESILIATTIYIKLDSKDSEHLTYIHIIQILIPSTHHSIIHFKNWKSVPNLF